MKFFKSIVLAAIAGYLTSQLTIWVDGRTVIAFGSAYFYFIFLLAHFQKSAGDGNHQRKKKTKSEPVFFDLIIADRKDKDNDRRSVA